ncbi:MAG: glycosyltransferase family 4 protein [Bacteroidota bacterium]
MLFPQIPLVDYNHMEEDYWNTGGHPQQSVIYKSIFSHHIVSSLHLKEWMVKRGNAADKISVVYTGIDFQKTYPSLDKRAAIRQQWKVDDNLCIIVFSGRITSQKQPLILVNTIKELVKYLPEGGFVLAIVGDGPDKSAIEEWVSANELTGKVWFFGALDNNDTISIMQASDIFFLPSLWEGISLSIYEAMAVGLPIVSANVGGQKELVTFKEGFLIQKGLPEKEVNDYSRVLSYLIKDKEKRRQMGIDARLQIENKFGIHAMWRNMEDILSNVILANEIPSKYEIIDSFRQAYALLFYEKTLSHELWQANQFYQSQF